MYSWLNGASRCLRAALTATALVALVPAHAAEAEEVSELKVQPAPKLVSLLFVGTSGANTNRDLGNKQALVAAEMRKLLKARGLEVNTMGLRPEDPDPAATVALSIQKFSPSHLVHLTVPKGTVSVDRLTREQIAAVDYVIHVEASDARTKQLVWEYSRFFKTGLFGYSNTQAAEAVVKKMQDDGLLP
jgi:hypothetical protein